MVVVAKKSPYLADPLKLPFTWGLLWRKSISFWCIFEFDRLTLYGLAKPALCQSTLTHGSLALHTLTQSTFYRMSLSITSALTPENMAFVASYVANGNNASKAVAEVWPMLPLASAQARALVMMRNKAIVSAIENTVQENTILAVKSTILSKQEKREFLARRVRLNGPILPNSEFADGVKFDKEGNEVVQTFGKLEAIKEDNKMAGDYEAEKVSVTAQAGSWLDNLLDHVTGQSALVVDVESDQVRSEAVSLAELI